MLELASVAMTTYGWVTAAVQTHRTISNSQVIISRALRAQGYRYHLTMDGFKVQGSRCVCGGGGGLGSRVMVHD